MITKRPDALLIACALAGLAFSSASAARPGDASWQTLFDGETLQGWIQRNGTARYEVEGGAIVGTTVAGSPNSFLCTEKDYGNFILELDFKVDEGLNSGIQIRSQSLDDYLGGRVHGYQVEIDPAQTTFYSGTPPNLRDDGEPVPAGGAPRCWTGGIYDEARRGWLCDLTRSEAARQAFKPGAWNHFRIEALGDSIRTWVNGVPAASLADSLTPNGFIALQVHATDAGKPMQVRWKNLRLQDLGVNGAQPDPGDLVLGDWQSGDGATRVRVFLKGQGRTAARLLTLQGREPAPDVELECLAVADPSSFAGAGWTLTPRDRRLELSNGRETIALSRRVTLSPTLNLPPPPGAVVLFAGESVDEWVSQKPKEWEASDGPATDWKLLPGGRLEAVPGAGSIITSRRFGDFKLHLEFRTVGPVNSGVYLQTRYEVGLKDSYGQTDGSPCGAPGNFSGSGADPVLPNVAAPPFQWQTLDIDFRAPRFKAGGTEKTDNARVTTALNGIELYRDFEVVSVKGAAKRLGEVAVAPLMLQEHGSPIQFRNIWIVERSR